MNKWPRYIEKTEEWLREGWAAHLARETAESESQAFLASWRARQPPSPARGHMPFPGFRNMKETG